MADGLFLDFESVPSQARVPKERRLDDEQSSIGDKEVASMLEKGAIKVSSRCPGDFFSTIFVIPKKSGGFRPVINLKGLNRFLVYRHFKMEGAYLLKHLVRKGDYFIKLDLKDAYFPLAICPEHRRFLKFQWKGIVYEFCTMPFGLSSAPWAFTKIMRSVVAALRNKGIKLIVYLDDMLIIGPDPAAVLRDFQIVSSLLESLGFVINWDKSVTSPAQIMEFLGLIVDSTRLSVSLPPAKVASIIEKCADAYSRRSVTLRAVASILGDFAWASTALTFASAHYRAIQAQYIGCSASRELSEKITLDNGSLEDLRWWIENLKASNGKPLTVSDPDIIIYSDASLTGWGGFCNGVRTRGQWGILDRQRHINDLELLAALHSLRSFIPHGSGLSVLLYMDNATAVSYVNKKGGSRSRSLNEVALAIINWCELRSISLRAVYLPGSLNFIADQESRMSPDSSDWRLSPVLFSKLASRWEMRVDLFASSWNNQVDKFVSWRPQPGAWRVNAFTFPWRDLQGYVFPPFSLIKDCLFEIRQEEAEVVLIAPPWTGQPWFPILLELASDVPLILPQTKDLLSSVTGEPHPLSLEKTILLTAWKLSGQDSQSRAFRNQWSTYSWQESVPPHRLLTSRPGLVGVIGATKGAQIPCLLLSH